MKLRVLRIKVELCLQTSYKKVDFHTYRRDVVLFVDKTFVEIGLVVPWKTPIEI